MPGAVLVGAVPSGLHETLLFSAGLLKKSNTEPEPPPADAVPAVVSAGVVDQGNLSISVGGFVADSDGGGLSRALSVGVLDVQGKVGGLTFEAKLSVGGMMLVLDAWMNGLLDAWENGFAGAESRAAWVGAEVPKPFVVGGF